jgi:hypothetical protein
VNGSKLGARRRAVGTAAQLDFARTLPDCRGNPVIDVSREVVLRQSRLHSGVAQIFLALFALLATLAPGFDAPLPGNEAGQYVSAPADPRSDGTSLLRATLGVAEDLEEETDEEEATSHVFATLHCPVSAEYRTADAWIAPFHWLSAHFCTGPPIL